MKDLRTPIAKALDKWLESEDGKRFRGKNASRISLENRLILAFLAGWNSREKEMKV
ncbi:MAG: hypothetical protein PHV11_08525 [Candidatus Bipolaricaulis sp.]|jgi:hypothetical protein|nr:hypothetical protein [Candidatus Bipolaricaulis sp.]